MVLQKTASIVISATPERAFDTIQATMARAAAGGASQLAAGPAQRPVMISYVGGTGRAAVEHAFRLAPSGSGTRVDLTYSMPRASNWDLGARAAMAVGVPGQLAEALQMIKAEAESEPPPPPPPSAP